MNWRKSSFSFSNGNCIEVAEVTEVTDWRKPSRSYGSGMCVEAADWRKSGYSESGNCVEVASGVAVRDTKDREGPVLKFSAPAWRAFLGALQGLDTGKHEAYASERIP